MKAMRVFPLPGIDPLYIGLFMAKLDTSDFAELKKTLK